MELIALVGRNKYAFVSKALDDVLSVDEQGMELLMWFAQSRLIEEEFSDVMYMVRNGLRRSYHGLDYNGETVFENYWGRPLVDIQLALNGVILCEVFSMGKSDGFVLFSSDGKSFLGSISDKYKGRPCAELVRMVMLYNELIGG